LIDRISVKAKYFPTSVGLAAKYIQAGFIDEILPWHILLGNSEKPSEPCDSEVSANQDLLADPFRAYFDILMRRFCLGPVIHV
jgi:hypothetical protein